MKNMSQQDILGSVNR